MTLHLRSISLSLLLPSLFIFFTATHAENQQIPQLPEPLTLEFALTLADEEHPDILQSRAALDLAHSEQLATAAEDGVNVSIRGRLRWVDPSRLAIGNQNDDNMIGIFASKKLYDFGRSTAKLAAADADIQERELLYTDMKSQRRIAIMAAYFDVMLADLEYIRDNEDMATAFISFDRSKDRKEQGQLSDVELLKAESEYMHIRRKRYASDARRRVARAHLANVINRPGLLSSDLALPKLVDNERKLPDVGEMQKLAIQNNIELLSLRKRLEAAHERLRAARSGKYPVLTGELEAADYSRETRTSDDVRAGITLEIPLTKGGAVSAEIGRSQAVISQVRAELAAKEMQVKQMVLESWREIYVLRAQRDEMNVLADYRDLYLDRSRALYELDIKTDLGDAMVRFSDTRLQSAKTNYELALAWARLDALVGNPVYELDKSRTP